MLFSCLQWHLDDSIAERASTQHLTKFVKVFGFSALFKSNHISEYKVHLMLALPESDKLISLNRHLMTKVWMRILLLSHLPESVACQWVALIGARLPFCQQKHVKGKGEGCGDEAKSITGIKEPICKTICDLCVW